jgi:hypothetical protein
MGSASGPRVISGLRRASMTITHAGAATTASVSHACTARFAVTLTAQAMQAAGLIYCRGKISNFWIVPASKHLTFQNS